MKLSLSLSNFGSGGGYIGAIGSNVIGLPTLFSYLYSSTKS
jgi:hypothetical protein